MLTIRPEASADEPAVEEILQRTFGQNTEAQLVASLRSRKRLSLALLALEDQRAVGYIAFSPLHIEGPQPSNLSAQGLAPLAVLPDYHGRGIGQQLVEAGLRRGGRAGWDLIFVLGTPAYYARFGFVSAAYHALRWEQDCPAPCFMVKALTKCKLVQTKGVVYYDQTFAEI